jgi:hypothetical protein
VAPQATNRAADSAIAGFAYQFDLSALLLLQSDDDTEMTVEGCEDVDLRTADEATAVQCKYHEAQKFSLPLIRKPILLMLKAFADGRHWNYRLYAHFSDESGAAPSTLTREQLKACLTEQKKDEERTLVRHYAPYSDDLLDAFLEKLTIEEGPSLAAQREELSAALQEALGATADDVLDLHYGAALTTVMNLATRRDEGDRRIKRPEFIEMINRKPIIFTRWQMEYLGKVQARRRISARLKSLNMLRAAQPKTVVLGADVLATATPALTASHFIRCLAHRRFGPGTLATTQPWTFILDAGASEIAGIKTTLIECGFIVWDGFEHVKFNAPLFDTPPLVNTKGKGAAVKAVSYDVRIIGASTWLANCASLAPAPARISFGTSPIPEDDTDVMTQRVNATGLTLEDALQTLQGAL